MNSRFAGALALTILCASSFCHAGDELLVLRNGYVLSGEVSRVGDRYIVRVGQGSETRIPLAAVEFRCRDIDDAYRQKCNRIQNGRVNERIEFIEWCLRHELFPQAEEQLVICEQLDPLNPRLHQLRRRLDIISEDEYSLVSAPVSKHRLKSEDLDLMMRGLPTDAVEQFTTHVQPLFVNRCSTGGCHGQSSESAFRLIRPRPGRELARSFTQRNLYAALQTIDRGHPLNSPLAKVLSKPHGPNNSVQVTLSQDQADQVAQWIKSLSRGNVAERPSTISATAQTLRQTSSGSNRGVAVVKNDESSKTLERRLKREIAAPDPFDPEVFNRRYHSKSQDRQASYHRPGRAPSQHTQPPPNFKSPIPRR